MKHAYFLIFIVQLFSAFPSMPIQSDRRPTKTKGLFCNDLHECNKMDPNMHCLFYDYILIDQHDKQYHGTCQCKDGYTWNLDSCDQKFQHSRTEEIFIVVGIIALVIIAIVVFAFVMTFCGDPTDKIQYYSNIRQYHSLIG